MKEKTRFYSHPLMLKHGISDHSENSLRLERILALFQSSPAGNQLTLDFERFATPTELALAHAPEYIQHVFSLEGKYAELDYETFLSPDSVAAARLAAGLGLELTEKIVAGTLQSGFAIVRPPGHHAGIRTGMGYCVFNSIAIAARRALQLGLKKILILDWDVHHGNGTQEIFYNDSQVLMIDLHQDALFPVDTGDVSQTGAGEGEGYMLNISLNEGCHDQDYWRVFEQQVAPRARDFRPELILVSAGFDAHENDPHGDMRLSTEGFAGLMVRTKALAHELCGGKLLLFLEGGYNSDDLARDVVACAEALAAD